MHITIPDQVCDCLRRLEENGFEAYVVGGAVRDLLRAADSPPCDYDVATNARPEAVMKLFSDRPVIPTGLPYGTVTVLAENLPIEITTYRADGEYSDGRRPEAVVFFDSLKEDVMRRDFTINGLAANRFGEVVDLVDGLSDLRRRRIFCIGDPAVRFQEDALRILRALRFSSVFGFSIEDKTGEQIQENINLLKNVSVERIWHELILFLTGEHAAKILSDFRDVFNFLIPELLPMQGFDQQNPWHYLDVFDHTIAVLSHTPKKKELRLAALFHDIGKPDSYQPDEDGIGHFSGHHQKSRDIVNQILRRLRADTKTRKYVESLVYRHDIDMISSEKIIRRRLSQFGEDFVRDILTLQRADTLGQSKRARYRLDQICEAEKILDKVIEKEGVLTLKNLTVHGEDILALGILPGPQVGEILARIKERVIQGDISNEKEVLINAALEIINQGK